MKYVRVRARSGSSPVNFASQSTLDAPSKVDFELLVEPEARESKEPKCYSLTSTKKHSLKRYVCVLIVAALLCVTAYKRFWFVITPLQLKESHSARECVYLSANNIASRARTLEDPNPKIGLVTFFHGMNKNLARISTENKHTYAKEHGYDLIVADSEVETVRQPHWSKFPILLNHLENYDYLMWVDGDALFANFSIKVESLIDGHHDLFIARDENNLNSGVFILRNSDWSRWYLKTAYEQDWLVTSYNYPSTHEQRAVQYLHGAQKFVDLAKKNGRDPFPKSTEVREHTNVIPHCALNSNVCEEFFYSMFTFLRRTPLNHFLPCKNMFKTGNFIIHPAGKSPSAYKTWLIQEFEKKINRINNLS
mmetsp:Transcript_14689/g.31336  ORF Transcript_14689/g.31336 Transcript_14689/m.31336 type:complete len:365 (-) Transcript_14689:471-1565(-)